MLMDWQFAALADCPRELTGPIVGINRSDKGIPVVRMIVADRRTGAEPPNEPEGAMLVILKLNDANRWECPRGADWNIRDGGTKK
jgi:hypothetical protein